MEGYPQPGFVLWSLSIWALGVLCGVLVEEWRWRRRRTVERADKTSDADRAARRAAAAPLRDALAATESVLRQYGPGSGSHASVLTEDSLVLDRALLALRDSLPPGQFSALEQAVEECTGQQAKADREHALAAIARARALVVSFAAHS